MASLILATSINILFVSVNGGWYFDIETAHFRKLEEKTNYEVGFFVLWADKKVLY